MDAMLKQTGCKAGLWLIALGVLGALANCDQFLVSICNREDLITCKHPTDGSQQPPSQDGGSGMDAGFSGVRQNGPEVSFEWRASITLTDGHSKFAGIYMGQPLIWRNEPVYYFQTWVTALNQSNPAQRVYSEQCPSCPTFAQAAAHISFASDQIRVSNGPFYLLKYHGDNHLIQFVSGKAIDGIELANTATPQPFAHPLVDTLVLPIQQSRPDMGYMAGTAVLQGGAVREAIAMGSMPTSFVVGDLDAVDQQPTGPELIMFGGTAPILLQHLWPAEYPKSDGELLNSLSNAIARAKAGDEAPIIAAFMSKLNGDAFPDLLYVKSQSIYITSYHGRVPESIGPEFQNWSNPVLLNETSGEQIRSVVAVELTNDTYPELIVETDKAVHLYLNKGL